MKWSFINPTKGYYNWTAIDRLIEFAAQNNMAVKGHGLISSCCNPDYLLNITDPTSFRAAMTAHFEAVKHQFDGKADRWDVVIEALETMAAAFNPTSSTKYSVPITSKMLSASPGRQP